MLTGNIEPDPFGFVGVLNITSCVGVMAVDPKVMPRLGLGDASPGLYRTSILHPG